MENRINQIVEFENGMKYYILKQAVYTGDNYFIAAEVTNDEEDFKENFVVLHETKEKDDIFVEIEDDAKTIQTLLKHLNIKEG
ncbi:MAG: hypothetical protein RSD09_02410 [Bacilli bacterium]